MAIAEFNYPPEKNTLVFIFDQSSPQHQQNDCVPWMESSHVCKIVWAGRVQKLVDDKGVPKG